MWELIIIILLLLILGGIVANYVVLTNPIGYMLPATSCAVVPSPPKPTPTPTPTR